MKISILLWLLCTVTFASNTYSQSKSISLTVENTSIKDILHTIEKQSSYTFFYNEQLTDINRLVNLSIEGSNIQEVLDQLFFEGDISFKILENDLIVIAPSRSAQQLIITGTVVEASNGEPLAGVNIQVEGTLQGTITDEQGKYSLEVRDPDAVLIFSYIGFVTEKVSVTGKSIIDISLAPDILSLEEVVVVGYGTVKKSDLTGSVANVKTDDLKTSSMVQITEMLTGRIAGLNTNQGTSAEGGASLEIRGPTSLNAGTNPLIVLDGVIFNGSLSEINPYDIVSVDILKDASSAAVFGSKAASGVILITTAKGITGKPIIKVSTKIGMAESNIKRRGLSPEEFIQFRQDYLRQVNPNTDPDLYTHPEKLTDMTIDQWRALSPSPIADNTMEWMARINLYPEEQANYLSGKTMDAYDYIFRKGLRQEYDISISGGTDVIKYYWSLGYNDNEGIIVGDQYSSVRSRLNLDFKITNWLNAGINGQFADRDAGSVPASLSFYANSPYGDMFETDGSLKRLTDGHTDNPLLNYYRTSVMDKRNSLFASLYVSVKLPFGFNFKASFQPRYELNRYFSFTTISPKLGGMDSESPSGERSEDSSMNWMVDNLLTWKKEIGVHSFDVTLLANVEKNQFWSSMQTNRNFLPNQQLGYHALQYGDSPGIVSSDAVSTGDAYMARLNYALMGKYLLTATVRRDGYSAFGQQNPRATFPAFALAWVISEESFFKVDLINRLKIRLSWGANGNRDIGIYSALANTSSSLWYDGTDTRVGVYTASLSNAGLRWERTSSFNLGFDMNLLNNRIDLAADYYDMTTTNLLMYRVLPRVTGFGGIMSNLGELGNRGFEMSLTTVNISQSNFSWKSNVVFSLNRNKIKKLFGDIGPYTLLGEERTGELPDFSNEWFPGQSIDVIWDYDVIGIWQTDEADKAAEYYLEPGDFKAVDVDGDGSYVNLNDKKFIGYEKPRYRLGLRNDFSFLQNFTASVFIRADLGHLGQYRDALNEGWVQNDCQSRNVGPVPYWTKDKPNNEYARLNTEVSGFGGGLMIYKPSSFIRIQDVSLTYNLPHNVTQRIKVNNMQIFGSVRNLATFTKWPGWDPESGMDPMPRTYTFGLNFSL